MKTRFAPSPNGLLHIGHAYSAMQAHDLAVNLGGEFHVRIEDIDLGRSREEFVDAIWADLNWLGLKWQGQPVFQSRRLQHYADAAARLRQMGVLYPCTCSRSDVRDAAHETGPEGPIYPGTCRGRTDVPDKPHSWRIDMAKAAQITGPLAWEDMRAGTIPANPEKFGDVILDRKETPASYHLSVVVDDADGGMTHIVRGMDLFDSTHVHRVLQALLDLPPPVYLHHDLLTGPDGDKLSKSKLSPPLSQLRQSGVHGPDLLHSLRKNIFPTGISAAKSLN